MIFKLIVTNSGIIFLAFTIMGIIVSMVYHSIVVSREKQTMEVYLRNTLESVDNKIKDMSRVSLIAFSDDITLDILQHIDSYGYAQRLRSQDYLKSLWTKLISIRNDITGVYLFNDEELIFYQTTTLHVVKSNYPMNNFIARLEAAEAMPVYGTANHRLKIATQPEFLMYNYNDKIDPFNDPYENFCVNMIREVRTFSPNKRIGHILLVAPVSAFKETLGEFNDSNFSSLLFDREGTVIFSEGVSKLGQNLEFLDPEIYATLAGQTGIFTGYFDGKKSLIAYRKSPYSGISLLTAMPLRYVYQNTFFFISILILIYAAVTSLVIILTGKFTRNIIAPIHALSTAMVNFSKETVKEHLPVDSEDEAGQLTAAFNTMKKTIDRLIFAEYEYTIKLKTMQLRQKEAQLENLRTQINPHFLYNTLDNIRIKAALNGDTETAEMIMLLVEFFRCSMEEITHLVPIAHEIKLLRIYLALMAYRYPKLESFFEIDEDLLSIRMPSFILQPIVENCLHHGLKSVNYRGKIHVSLIRDYAQQDIVQIKISDNGKGLDENARKRIAGMLREAESDTMPGGGHIGIANVERRLRMFYSPPGGLFFEDNPQGGLTVIIKLKEQPDNPAYASMEALHPITMGVP
jgi:sensor histidine kinase YesM